MINVSKLPDVGRRSSPEHPTSGGPYLAALILLTLLVQPAAAQQCLHGADESASERRRREDAVAFVARVNAAQKAALQDRGSYLPLADAASPGDTPLGFVPRLTVDQWSYAISLKDLFDPCGFAVFSDQEGRIYEGRPVPGPAAASAEEGRAPEAAPAAVPPDERESRE